MESRLIAHKKNTFGFSGLIKTDKMKEVDYLESEKPTLDDIMIYYSKAERNNE